jgi:WhiB family redox-sensing transcriptional regulator
VAEWASDRRPGDDLPSIGDLRPAWHDDAACGGTGPEQFFPVRGRGRSNHGFAAKATCARCPVVEPCLVAGFAETDDLGGIWGGAGGQDRSWLRTLWLARGRDPEAWEAALAGHRQRLAIHAAPLRRPHGAARSMVRPSATERPPVPNRNGPRVTHGRRGVYAKGCRCPPCRWSATAIGQVLARLGVDTAAHWVEHAEHGADAYASAREGPDREGHRLVAAALGGLLAAAGHHPGVDAGHCAEVPVAVSIRSRSVAGGAGGAARAGDGADGRRAA